MIQSALVIIIGVLAVSYVAVKFLGQFQKIENNPKCKGCPVPELRKNSLNN